MEARFREQAQQSTPTLTPAELMWQYAYSLSGVRDEIEGQLRELDEANAERAKGPMGWAQRAEQVAADQTYQEKYIALVNIKDAEAAVLELLEQHEAGEISEAVLAEAIPQDFKDAMEEEHETGDRSPKKVEHRVLPSSLLWYVSGYSDILAPEPVNRADAARLTSGRNKTKVAFKERVTELTAESAFFTATTDTHGGKVRKIGKNPKYYVSKSGKRVRKH